jgi:hypothetical protein
MQSFSVRDIFEGIYRKVVLGATDIKSVSDTDDVAFVEGFRIALIAFEPWIAGLKVQVADTDGAAPEVATNLHPGIDLPLLRKVTHPGVSAVAVIDFEIPLKMGPDTVGLFMIEAGTMSV